MILIFPATNSCLHYRRRPSATRKKEAPQIIRGSIVRGHPCLEGAIPQTDHQCRTVKLHVQYMLLSENVDFSRLCIRLMSSLFPQKFNKLIILYINPTESQEKSTHSHSSIYIIIYGVSQP